MAAPARTSLDEIVSAGLGIVEERGLSALTMARVAQAVGVKPPSLYKRLRNLPELVRLITTRIVAELAEELDNASFGPPEARLRQMAGALRGFAHQRPGAYGLLFAHLPDEWRPDAELLARASAPVLRAVEALTGPERALEGARLVVAWAHGFIDMELSGVFRLGGDLDAAFEFGMDRLIRALATAEPPTAG